MKKLFLILLLLPSISYVFGQDYPQPVDFEEIQKNIEDPGSRYYYPDLWERWLETLGVDPEATEVCLKLSPLDENKKV